MCIRYMCVKEESLPDVSCQHYVQQHDDCIQKNKDYFNEALEC